MYGEQLPYARTRFIISNPVGKVSVTVRYGKIIKATSSWKGHIVLDRKQVLDIMAILSIEHFIEMASLLSEDEEYYKNVMNFVKMEKENLIARKAKDKEETEYIHKQLEAINKILHE